MKIQIITLQLEVHYYLIIVSQPALMNFILYKLATCEGIWATYSKVFNSSSFLPSQKSTHFKNSTNAKCSNLNTVTDTT